MPLCHEADTIAGYFTIVRWLHPSELDFSNSEGRHNSVTFIESVSHEVTVSPLLVSGNH
jgi:hypothetical protein